MRPVAQRLGRRGVALMLVLWLIVVLGVVAVGVAASSRSETQLTINLRARAAARYAAESGIVGATNRLRRLLGVAVTQNASAQVFRDVDRHLSDLREAAMGDARFGVALVDLNARIDLNYANEATLRNLFAEFVDGARAGAIVAALRDWQDPDDFARPNGAEARDYARLGSPYLPRNGPLQRLDDLAHVRGVGDSLAARVAPYVTVNGDGHVNLNSAPETVLAALPGLGPAGARKLAARRAGGEVFTSTAVVQQLIPADAPGAGTTFVSVSVAPTRLLFVSRGWLAGHPLTHEIQAVFGVAGSLLYLQAWRERDL